MINVFYDDQYVVKSLVPKFSDETTIVSPTVLALGVPTVIELSLACKYLTILPLLSGNDELEITIEDSTGTLSGNILLTAATPNMIELPTEGIVSVTCELTQSAAASRDLSFFQQLAQ